LHRPAQHYYRCNQLWLITGRPLLERPHVPIWVTEVRIKDASHIVYIAQFDTAPHERLAGRPHVVDD